MIGSAGGAESSGDGVHGDEQVAQQLFIVGLPAPSVDQGDLPIVKEPERRSAQLERAGDVRATHSEPTAVDGLEDLHRPISFFEYSAEESAPQLLVGNQLRNHHQ